MSTARKEKYDRRQREVVSIAAALFARRGFQATTMDELSDATGLRSGGLYHYIGSKQRLLFQIFQALMESRRLPSVQDQLSALRKRFLIVSR